MYIPLPVSLFVAIWKRTSHLINNLLDGVEGAPSDKEEAWSCRYVYRWTLCYYSRISPVRIDHYGTLFSDVLDITATLMVI